MSRHFPILSALVVGLVTATSASAQVSAPAIGNPGLTHEITGGTNGTLSFGGGTTTIGLGLGYHYLIMPEMGIQVGYTTNLNYQSANDVSATNWSNIVGGRYNFANYDSNMMNQPFIDAGIGLDLRSGSVGPTSNTDTKFLFDVGGGKRFQLGPNVSYIPRVSIRKIADENLQWNITPIAFSIFLG